MKQCLCNRKDKHLEDLKPGDFRNGEIHGAEYCSDCGGIIMCDFCTAEGYKPAMVVTYRHYACWDHCEAAKESATKPISNI